MAGGLFEFVKSNIKISDYVRTLPNVKGLHSTGAGTWRCNNVIADTTNNSSMFINDDGGFFRVFSHGNESGDIITLYGILNNSVDSARDSAIALANEMGVAIDPSLLRTTGGTSKFAMNEAMDKLADATNNYLANSQEDEAILAREYLHSRGMPDEMRDKWKIGLFPSFMGDSMDMIEQCGGKEIFKETGIVSDSDNPIVVMSGRISFPIFSQFGKCISFSSREIEGIDCYLQGQKYINTSSTPIYHKREVLYGLHLAKRRATERIIICEGNMDVLALNEQTPENTVAVATCGTALTEEHISVIRKMDFKEVILKFDSDDAGQSATNKSLWIVNNIDNVFVHSKGTGKDPWDSYEAGEEFNLSEGLTPMITFAASYGAKMGKQDMMQWFKSAYMSLNFDSDKNQLISETERLSGVSKRQLLIDIDVNAPNNRKNSVNNSNNNNEYSLSPYVKTIVSAMLSVKPEEKEILFYPFFSHKLANKAIILVNGKTKNDIGALRIGLGKEKNADGDFLSEVISLMPDDNSSDSVLYFAAVMLANRIKREWSRFGINKGYEKFVPLISNISGGVYDDSDLSNKELLFMVMNCVNSISE